MKIQPNGADREAARLFKPAGGMLFAWLNASGHWVWERVADWHDGRWPVEGLVPGEGAVFDTDDPATVGCMLVQAEAAIRGFMVARDVMGNGKWRAWGNVWDKNDHTVFIDGSTRGAALVAAMRALRPR